MGRDREEVEGGMRDASEAEAAAAERASDERGRNSNGGTWVIVVRITTQVKHQQDR